MLGDDFDKCQMSARELPATCREGLEPMPRETREWGWPLLTVETKANGDSWSTYEKGPSLVGSMGSSCWYNFCSALAALVSPVKNTISLTTYLFTLFSPHRPATWADSSAGSSVSVSLLMLHTSATPRLTIATPRLAKSESRRPPTRRVGESPTRRVGRSFSDYEYLREFEAKIGTARKVV